MIKVETTPTGLETCFRTALVDRILFYQNKDYIMTALEIVQSLLDDSYVFKVKATRKDTGLQWAEAEQSNYWGE